MKFLKDFMEEYPGLDFWEKVSFGEKLESLKLLKGEVGRGILKKKHLEFNYTIPDKKTYPLGEKVGQDIVLKREPKTIKTTSKRITNM